VGLVFGLLGVRTKNKPPSSVIMAFRVYALYQARKTIIVPLGTLIVVETILMTVQLYYRFGERIGQPGLGVPI